MKVLFAVSNAEMSEKIVKQYQKEYKEIISYKNVYYYNAILKELQRDKTYDRIVISEDLEQFVNPTYEEVDKFLFERLDSISDEASNMRGEDIPIILICTERRNKGESILVKLFGIGVYNAIIGVDRSVPEVCRLISRPRSKKEAKIYYKIDAEDVSYEKNDENDVSEMEIQSILAHYKKLGSDETRYVESFDSIASQYNDVQLRIISKCLPLNVRAVLEAGSAKYQQVNSYNNKISDSVRVKGKETISSGPSEMLLKGIKTQNINEPVVVPSAIGTTKQRKIVSKSPADEVKKVIQPIKKPEEVFGDIEIEEIQAIPEITDVPEELLADIDIGPAQLDFAEEQEYVEEKIQEPVKRGRGRPRKIVTEPVVQEPKRGRGRPRKVVEPEIVQEKQEVYEEESFLPGIQEEKEYQPLDNFNQSYEEDDDETILPGFESNDRIEEQYTSVLKNLKEENEKVYKEEKEEEIQYEELDMYRILEPDQKVVAFLGTSKNGTSFLINNVAELLSASGVDTAILDLTQNRNSYYIYTKNEEQLREQSNHIMSDLIAGNAKGIKQRRNLTVYTSASEEDEKIKNVEPIIETLARNHTVILMDCDFSTPMKYFKYAQEIYLVQSMDILTIQPLTAFLRKLSDKGILEESKVRVVLNKFVRTREINEELLIGGISIYNDASMTVRKELFNRRTVKYLTIPFEVKTYLRYLEGLVVCDVSLKGYSKEFMQSLKRLAGMIYNGINIGGKYKPPSVKNNNTFSPNMSNTLKQMKQNY